MRNGNGAAKVKVLKPEDSAKISNFIANLTNSDGTKLGNLQRRNLSRDPKKSKVMLDEISIEQGFAVTYVGLDEKTGRGDVQYLVQISTLPVFVAAGVGVDQGKTIFSDVTIWAVHKLRNAISERG